MAGVPNTAQRILIQQLGIVRIAQNSAS